MVRVAKGLQVCFFGGSCESSNTALERLGPRYPKETRQYVVNRFVLTAKYNDTCLNFPAWL